MLADSDTGFLQTKTGVIAVFIVVCCFYLIKNLIKAFDRIVWSRFFQNVKKTQNFLSMIPTLISNSGYLQNLMRNPNLERKK
jgi:hypothetical protein